MVAVVAPTSVVPFSRSQASFRLLMLSPFPASTFAPNFAQACFVQARHRRVQVIYSRRSIPNVLLIPTLAVVLVLLPSGSKTRIPCHSLAVTDLGLLVCLVPDHIVAYRQVAESLAIGCLLPQLQN